MIPYLTKRILFSAFVFALVGLVSFAIVSLYPGDFYTGTAGILMRFGMSREEAYATEEIMRIESGIDKSFFRQFIVWFGGVITDLDFGISLQTRGPVGDYILRRGGELAITLAISGSSLILAFAVGIPAGLISGARRGRLPDIFLTLLAYPLATLPGFYVGIILQWLIFRYINTLMIGAGLYGMCGWQFVGQPLSWAKFGSCLLHMLPLWFVVGGPAFATVVRILRMSMLDTMSQQYILVARGKGLSDFRVLSKHALRNAINPLISTFGTLLPFLLVNTILVAKIFGVPAFGRLFIESIRTQDPHLVAAGLLIYATFLVAGNLIADILLIFSDPRIRFD